MKETLLTRRYAKAFLDFAIKNDMTDAGLADFEMISETLNESHELRSILSEPFISNEKKTDIITRVFRGNVSEHTLSFIRLMINKNRADIIGDVYGHYHDLYNEYKNISIVTITTAVSIDEATTKRFLYFVKDVIDGDIKIVNKLDKDIIGGFIIQIGDYVYDASIKTKLKNLSKIFTENLYVKGF